MLRWMGIVISLLALVGGLVPPGVAQEVRYRGRDPGTGAGWIETGPGQMHAVYEGDELPGWGRVTAVKDDHLRIELVLTPQEQEALEAQGAMPVTAREIVVPHQDLIDVPRRWP